MSSSPASKTQPSIIVAGVQRQDRAAIEWLYEEYGGTVLGYLIRALGDRGAAEDVLQQVFTELWRTGPRYDPERASLLTWIMLITKRRASDQRRKRVPEPIDPADRKATAIADRDAPLEKLLGDWQIGHLLRQLPREEAQVIALRFVEDKTQVEIAAETGIPVGTVKMRMVQGLDRLREMIDADGGIEL